MLELTAAEARLLKELVSIAWWDTDRERTQEQEPRKKKFLLAQQGLLEGLSDKLRNLEVHAL